MQGMPSEDVTYTSMSCTLNVKLYHMGNAQELFAHTPNFQNDGRGGGTEQLINVMQLLQEESVPEESI